MGSGRDVNKSISSHYRGRGDLNHPGSGDEMGSHNSINIRICGSSIKYDDVNSSGDVQNVQKKRQSNRVDDRHYQRLSASIDCSTDCISALLSSSNPVSALKRIKKPILKKLAFTIPFATVATTFISGITSKAHAEMKAPIDLLRKPAKNLVENNLIPQPIVDLANSINAVITWFKDLPQEIGQMSVNLMSWLYELCGDLILKTPIWIFNNEWFSNTTLMFSSIAIGIVTALTVVESIKRMLSGIKNSHGGKMFKPMEFQTIAKRWFMVAGLTTAVPWLFQKTFQGLNWVSEQLINMGADTMKAVALQSHIALLDVVTLIAFDIVLIVTIVPVLWQNGRRFFDLLVLGVTTPLALTAWIFDDYRHLFKQWWENLKQLSLVQVYYALFLLVIGWFMFGVPTPTSFTGFIIKLLVVIGGFARMSSPPRLISKHLDSGGGFDTVLKGGTATSKIKKDFAMTKKFLYSNPVSWYKKAFKPIPVKPTGKK
jgi:hypothetical protein